CPDGSWTKRGSYCYLAECTPRNAEQARERCASYDATLVSVHDLDEHLFIQELCRSANATFGYTCDVLFYLGLSTNDQGLTWVWDDGTPSDYFKWGGTEPNGMFEFCTAVNVMPGKGWGDVVCGREEGYICKRCEYIV
ncbi:hypothetical protein CAPTEDRAFT_144191, partial [Capitella teleta]